MKALDKICKRYWANWNEFWFKEIDLYPIALFRIALGFLFFLFFLSKTPDLEIFYTNKGFLPASYSNYIQFFTYQKSIFYYIDDLRIVTVAHFILLAATLCVMIGFRTRIATIITYFLHLMFINRNPAVQYGVDFVGSFFLLYLTFTKCGAWFSVDAWLLKRKNLSKKFNEFRSCDLLSSAFVRLMQIQVCVIYFYSGTSKLKGTHWWNGSAIWDVFSMEGLVRWDMSFIAWIPDVLVFICYLTLLWEIYFPVLIWLKPFRPYLIAFGSMMHLGFGLFLNIPIFGLLMMSAYLIFLDPKIAREYIELGTKRVLSLVQYSYEHDRR